MAPRSTFSLLLRSDFMKRYQPVHMFIVLSMALLLGVVAHAASTNDSYMVAVAVDAKGTIYVADAGGKCIFHSMRKSD